jgi:hypothetical protein
VDVHAYHPTTCGECLGEMPKSYRLKFHATFGLLGIIVGAIGFAVQSNAVIVVGGFVAAISLIGGINTLRFQVWPIGSRHRRP